MASILFIENGKGVLGWFNKRGQAGGQAGGQGDENEGHARPEKTWKGAGLASPRPFMASVTLLEAAAAAADIRSLSPHY